MPKLRDPLEMINSVGRLKLKADPQPDMALIWTVAERCLRYHPTLAEGKWRASIKMIRASLESIEDIYDRDNETAR